MSHTAHDTPVRSVDVTESRTADRSLGELFAQLSSQFSTLMQKEIALAKAELRAEAKKAGKAGGLLGGAAFTGTMTVLLLSFAAAWGLAELMPTWLAFLVVGVVYGIVTAVLGLTGKKEAQDIDPTPHATVDTLQEDADWAKREGREAAQTLKGAR